MLNKLAQTNIKNEVFSKLNAGNNLLNDWVKNTAIGTTQLGTPYYDSVKFVIGDFESEEYINSVISINNSASIVKTSIKGRTGGNIKQIVNEGDYNITFNIKIISPFGLSENDLDYGTIQRVGNSNLIPGSQLQNIAQAINDPLSLVNGPNNIKYQSDYYPNNQMTDLIDLMTLFYQDRSYKNIEVQSLYLNDIYSIYNIVPYRISTSQNNNETNTYNVTIQAYSDILSPGGDFTDEIIPN